MATASTTHNPVDEALQATELGTFISRNKTSVIGLVVLLILGVFAWGGYTAYQSGQNDKLGAVVYDFRVKNYESLITKKISTGDYTKAYLDMSSTVGNFVGLTPLAIMSSDELTKQGDLEGSLKILATVEGQKNPYIIYFVHSRKAVNYEDLGQIDMAITSLERIVKANIKVMESKTFLDLGRLYVKKGDMAKAKTNFQYVIDNMGQAEFVKLAKLYLAEMES